MTGSPDAVGDVDAAVALFAPGLRAPSVYPSDVVLVTGPWLAGTTSVIHALRERVPELRFAEAGELVLTEAPLAVIFVVSAVTPMTESDISLLDIAAMGTDLVIGVVSKIDVHRRWRDVLEADRAALIEHSQRYRDTAWVGVAAAPDLGDTRVQPLVDALRWSLADDTLARRNRLRAWESRMELTARQYRDAAQGTPQQPQVAQLHARREDLLRQRRLDKSERSISLRSQIQQARVQLSYFARVRCASVRAELQEDAAGVTRRRMPEFEAYVVTRAKEVIAEVAQGVGVHLADMAAELHLPAQPAGGQPDSTPVEAEVGRPPLKSRRLETRLMMVLGAGFGLGVALTLSRLFADLAPGLAALGAVACIAAGLAVTVWVVGTRGLLHDRAVLDRWVAEVTAALRTTVDQLVATRVLAAESELTTALAHYDETQAELTAARVAAIDVELRQFSTQRMRAAAVCDRRLPVVLRALDQVRAELRGAEV